MRYKYPWSKRGMSFCSRGHAITYFMQRGLARARQRGFHGESAIAYAEGTVEAQLPYLSYIGGTE